MVCFAGQVDYLSTILSATKTTRARLRLTLGSRLFLTKLRQILHSRRDTDHTCRRQTNVRQKIFPAHLLIEQVIYWVLARHIVVLYAAYAVPGEWISIIGRVAVGN